MTSHLDVDVLADYREGLLGRRRAARTTQRAHNLRTTIGAAQRCSHVSRDPAATYQTHGRHDDFPLRAAAIKANSLAGVTG